MFIDEVVAKLKIEDVACAYSLCFFGSSRVYLQGIKSLLVSSPTEMKMRVKNGVIRVWGEGLELLEIGGGDVYVKGGIKGVEFN